MDLTIIGGGVLGTMHAWFALRHGHRVLQIERDAEARSASVRNFGLVWVSGRRDGPELELAMRARELWAELGAAVPALGFRPHGSLTVAIDHVEFDVLESFAASDAARERHTVLLDPVAARERNPALGTGVAGALYCPLDAIVEPRVAQPAIRSVMESTSRYRFLPNRNVIDRSGTTVIDHTGEQHHADALVVCPGAVHDALLTEHFGSAPVRRCQLQMMETDPLDAECVTSIADIDSMRYYPAYRHLDLSSLPPQPPVAAAARMQLLLVQRLDGGLTIGDTHVYDDDPAVPFPFDVDEAPYEHLVARATAILGRPLPRIRRRWSGIYSELDHSAPPDVIYHRATVESGVVVVTGPGGRGMTLAPAIAERTWEDLT